MSRITIRVMIIWMSEIKPPKSNAPKPERNKVFSWIRIPIPAIATTSKYLPSVVIIRRICAGKIFKLAIILIAKNPSMKRGILTFAFYSRRWLTSCCHNCCWIKIGYVPFSEISSCEFMCRTCACKKRERWQVTFISYHEGQLVLESSTSTGCSWNWS